MIEAANIGAGTTKATSQSVSDRSSGTKPAAQTPDDRTFQHAIAQSVRLVPSPQKSGHSKFADKAIRDANAHASRKVVAGQDTGAESNNAIATPAVSQDVEANGSQAIVVATPAPTQTTPTLDRGLEQVETASVNVPVAGESRPARSASIKSPSRDGVKSDVVVTNVAGEAAISAMAAPISKSIDATPGPTSRSISVTPQPVAAIHGPHSAVDKLASSGKPASDVEMPSKSMEVHAPASDARTLVATPNVLEVGIESGTHGWLRVRAEIGSAGEVTASVVTASAGAAASLHKELPALAAYLATEDVAISSLVVNATLQGSGAQDASKDHGAAADSRMEFANDAGAQAGAGGHKREDAREYVTDVVANLGNANWATNAPGISGWSVPAAVYANGSGNWLSVRV